MARLYKYQSLSSLEFSFFLLCCCPSISVSPQQAQISIFFSSKPNLLTRMLVVGGRWVWSLSGWWGRRTPRHTAGKIEDKTQETLGPARPPIFTNAGDQSPRANALAITGLSPHTSREKRFMVARIGRFHKRPWDEVPAPYFFIFVPFFSSLSCAPYFSNLSSSFFSFPIFIFLFFSDGTMLDSG